MAAPPQQQLHLLLVQLSSEEELASRLATGGCKVLEVHSTWAGPCKSVVPLLKKLRLEGRDEEQLGFLAIAAEDCPTHHEHEGRSEPLFLVYRNGALKAKVQGANLPQLLAAIGEWTTPLPGLDDPEDNPFHLQLSKGAAAGSSKDKPKVVAKKK